MELFFAKKYQSFAIKSQICMNSVLTMSLVTSNDLSFTTT